MVDLPPGRGGLLLAAVALAQTFACSRGAPPTPGPAESVRPPAGEAEAPAAKAAASEPTDEWVRDRATAVDIPHRAAGMVARWPRRAASPLYVAMLNDDASPDEWSGIWLERSAEGGVSAHNYLWGGTEAPPRAMFALDLTGDGEAELVIVAGPGRGRPTLPWPRTVYVYAFAESDDPHPIVLAHERLGWLLSPAASEAEVRAAAPAVRAFAPPDAATPSERLVLRLQDATRAQLVALIAPGGLSSCVTHEGNAKPHSRRCRRLRPEKLTDDAAWRQARAALGYFDAPAADADPDPERAGVRVYAPVSCRRRGAREVCDAGSGGPGGVRWTFVGAGASRRLAEVDEYSYEDT